MQSIVHISAAFDMAALACRPLNPRARSIVGRSTKQKERQLLGLSVHVVAIEKRWGMIEVLKPRKLSLL